jgi:hypothetical protein
VEWWLQGIQREGDPAGRFRAARSAVLGLVARVREERFAEIGPGTVLSDLRAACARSGWLCNKDACCFISRQSMSSEGDQLGEPIE